MDNTQTQYHALTTERPDVVGPYEAGFVAMTTAMRQTRETSARDALVLAMDLRDFAITNYDNRIGDYIKSSDCTQSDLAQMLGVTRQAVSQRYGILFRIREREAERRHEAVAGEQELPLTDH